MSILIVSPDAEAARSLTSALGRSGHRSAWLESVASARTWATEDPPLVLIVDRDAERFRELIDDVCSHTPWVRVYEMAGAAVPTGVGERPVLRKPFDAAELATLLGREQELAELDRQKHTFEAQAEELALLVEASFEAIIGLGPTGIVRSWNRGAASIYGYAAKEIVGRSIDLLEVEPQGATSRLAHAAGQPVEAYRRAKDGREVIVLLSLSPVVNGTKFAFAETSLDITTRRKLERELEHEKRLAAIGRIAAAMAHEINNPLAVVRASNAYVAELARGSKDELLVETVEDVRLAVDRIGTFVNHVCGFARRERPMLSDASLRETVRMALRLAKPRAADNRVELLLEAGQDVRLSHDPTRVSQAVLNLVSNAIDAASEGGAHVIVRLVADTSSVRVQVDDDGCGVPEGLRERVFEPFATTKQHGKGTGLGLAITRQIVDDHGGTVTLNAGPSGIGTRAELTLPHESAAAARRPTENSLFRPVS
ncbi:MAG TPA: ATP-binding protein [Polyangiaceae bacterium]|jgi:two-component system sensor histidine kinase HydH|nr:ATP-binding protein [Polyangiaceae bacterium]